MQRRKLLRVLFPTGLLLALVATLLLASVTPGPEFQVNTSTAGAQFGAAAGMTSSGRSVIAWAQQALGGNGIFAQRYDSSGARQAGEIQVSGFTSHIVQGARVAMDAAGNFVVVWVADTTDNTPGVFPLRLNDVFARLFDANGLPKGPLFQVGSTNTTFHRASVAMDDDGNFVVVWGVTNPVINGVSVAGQVIFAKLFDASGNAPGPAFPVDFSIPGGSVSGNQFDPAVAMTPTGNFVVAWTGLNQFFSSGRIFAKRFDASGMAQGAAFQVDTSTTGNPGRPAVAMDGVGNFAITWDRLQQVTARAFFADGTPRGGESQVSDPLLGAATRPKVAIDGEGEFVVTWQNQTPSDEVNQVRARPFDADGLPLGSEFQVNDSPEDANSPAVAMDAAGNLVIAWDAPGDGDLTGVFARRYAVPVQAPISLSIGNPNVTEGDSGATVMTFMVTLSGANTQPVSVDFTTADGTAMSGVAADYLSASGSLMFNPAAPGVTTQTMSIDITINGDTLNEADETFFVNLSNPTNATVADAQGVGTIINDDLSLSINDVTITEGNSGTTEATFTVTLSAASTQTVTVDFATADDTATTADNDYVAQSDTVTFLPGETTKEIAVQVNGDTLSEPDETFFVNLSNATSATISDAQGAGTITNDDPVQIVVNEMITVTDTPGVLPSAMIGVAENIVVNDAPNVLPSAMIGVAENIVVTDRPTVLPSAMIGVAENIVVTDAPNVLPSALIGVAENITVTDVPGVLPSAMIGVAESITVTDAPDVLPSAMIGVAENITVSDAPQVFDTAVGMNVLLMPRDLVTNTSPVTLTFANVTQPGNTTLVISNVGPPPPSGFAPGNPPRYFDVTTTAVFTGNAQVCINYTGISFQGTPSLWHYENGNPNPMDITILPVDTLNMIVCGMVNSLSPFALFEPVAAQDPTPPVLSLPANITSEATSAAGAMVNFTAAATDAVDGAVPVSCMPASGATFPLGTTTVNCSASDAAGNSSSGSFSISVVDTTPPVLTLPGNITAEATSAAGAVVSFAFSANDAVDGAVAIVCFHESGDPFPLGTTTVDCIAGDAAGNFSGGRFDVTVVDTTPPVLTLARTSFTVVLPTPSATGAAVNVLEVSGAQATDAVDGVDVTLSFSPGLATFPLGTTQVNITAIDNAGNTSHKPFTVNVVFGFGGFLAPVRAGGSSVFKSGSVVTLKFQLFAANGEAITNAKPTLHVFKVTDAVLGTVEEIAPDAAGNSNTDNLFRYDAASQQYIYNLKTTGYTGGTYLLRAAPGDGTQHDVVISIR